MDHKRKCIALANEIGAVVFYCNTCTMYNYYSSHNRSSFLFMFRIECVKAYIDNTCSNRNKVLSGHGKCVLFHMLKLHMKFIKFFPFYLQGFYVLTRFNIFCYFKLKVKFRRICLKPEKTLRMFGVN